MNKFEVKRICRMVTVGVFAGMCLCGCPRERATSEEVLRRSPAAVVLETDAELVRELADVAWGRSDKKRLMDAFFIRTCLLFLYPQKTEDAGIELSNIALENNADFAALYFRSSARRKYFMKLADADDAQIAFLRRLEAMGEAFVSAANGRGDFPKEQRTSGGGIDAGTPRPGYETLDFRLPEDLPARLNCGRFALSAEEIESAIYFHYDLRGKANVAENGDYDLVYVLPDKRLLVCPMSGDDRLRAEIRVVEISELSIALGEESWAVEFLSK